MVILKFLSYNLLNYKLYELTLFIIETYVLA